MFHWPICLPALLALPFIFFPAQAVERSFKIDYEQNTFLKDGRPYRYISGEIHYFRDRLYRVRAAGLNAVQVYIPWNFHEEKPTSFNFDGDRNITKFLQLAQQNELDVLLRIGPYVCAELEFGGIPWWLIKDQADIVLRTSNQNYLLNVERYFDVLLPILKPLLYQNGGPIIMLQIENEYGSVLCDHTYTKWLRDLVRSRLGNDVVLYTTDGFNDWMVTCGAVEGTFPTVDFGAPQTELSVKNHFMVQQKHSGGGPNVNSEFYTTWFSMWGDKAIFKQQIPAVLNAIEIMWNQNASFSFYMIHGGTNFGFWSGMERDGPVITSYDYSAPISEEGQITPLYEAIRTWIGQKPDWPNPPLALPPNRTGLAIDNVVAVRLGNFIRLLNSTVGRSHQCLASKGRPINFEQFNEDHTFVWYSATLDVGGALLQIPELRDHAFVFLDGQFKGNLSVCDRSGCVRNLTLNGKAGQRLDLLVENAGRLTYPLTKVDPKGILSPVLLDGKPVGQTWLQCGVDIGALYSVAKLQFESRLLAGSSIDDEPPPSPNEPAIYVAKFNTAGIDWSQMHTFFDSRGWGYGVALVNGFNLGRYWPLLGPQMTLFVPGAVMHNENIVVLLELAGRQKSDNNIKFVASPVYSGVEYFDFSTTAAEEEVPERSTAAGGHLRKQQIAWDLRRRRLQDEPSIVARRARQSNQQSWHVEEKHHHLVEMEDIIF